MVLVSRSEGQTPPDPKGWTCAAAAPDTLADPWAPVQRESRTVRPISLAFLGVQQTVGRQSTRATPVARPAMKPFSATARRCHHALLNASAASESTAAGSLKACLIKRQRC